MKNFTYFRIPFAGVVNSRYVLTILFLNGFHIGIAKNPLRLLSFGFFKITNKKQRGI